MMAFCITVGALSAAPLAAQPLPKETIDSAKILPYFNVDTINATLKTVTGNHISTVTPAGENIITGYAPNGLEFAVHFLQCDQDIPVQCKALQLLTSWSLDDKKMDFQTNLPSFQRSHLFVNSGLLADGRPYLARIVLADQGLAQGNLAAEIRNFLSDATDFDRMLFQSAK